MPLSRRSRSAASLMQRLSPESLEELERAEQIETERALVSQAARVQAALTQQAAHTRQAAVAADAAAEEQGRRRVEAAERALRSRQSDERAVAALKAAQLEVAERQQRALARTTAEAAVAEQAAAVSASSRDLLHKRQEAERRAEAAERRERLERHAAAEEAAAEESQRRAEQKASMATARHQQLAEEQAERAAARSGVATAKVARVVEMRHEMIAEHRQTVEAQQQVKTARLEARRDAAERRIRELKALAHERRGALHESLLAQAEREEDERQRMLERLDEKAAAAQRAADAKRRATEERQRLKLEHAARARQKARARLQSLGESLERLSERLEARAETVEAFESEKARVIEARRRLALEASVERHRLAAQMQALIVSPPLPPRALGGDGGGLTLPPRLRANPVTDGARELLDAVDPDGEGVLRAADVRSALRRAQTLPTLYGPHSPPPRPPRRPPQPQQQPPSPLQQQQSSTPTQQQRQPAEGGGGGGGGGEPPVDEVQPIGASSAFYWQMGTPARSHGEQRRAWAQKHVWEPPAERGYSLDYYGPLTTANTHPAHGTGWTPPSTAVARGLAQPGFMHVPAGGALTPPLSHRGLPALRGVPNTARY